MTNDDTAPAIVLSGQPGGLLVTSDTAGVESSGPKPTGAPFRLVT